MNTSSLSLSLSFFSRSSSQALFVLFWISHLMKRAIYAAQYEYAIQKKITQTKCSIIYVDALLWIALDFGSDWMENGIQEVFGSSLMLPLEISVISAAPSGGQAADVLMICNIPHFSRVFLFSWTFALFPLQVEQMPYKPSSLDWLKKKLLIETLYCSVVIVFFLLYSS